MRGATGRRAPGRGAAGATRARLLVGAVACASLGALAACGDGAKSGRGFRLPDGDAEAGRRAFVDLHCFVCHSAPGIEAGFDGARVANVPLGGPTTRVRSYGELVTAIINPSHRTVLRVPRAPPGPEPGTNSPMELVGLNERMTVRQLVDLVAFLQGTYRVAPPEVDPYGYVYP